MQSMDQLLVFWFWHITFSTDKLLRSHKLQSVAHILIKNLVDGDNFVGSSYILYIFLSFFFFNNSGFELKISKTKYFKIVTFSLNSLFETIF